MFSVSAEVTDILSVDNSEAGSELEYIGSAVNIAGEFAPLGVSQIIQYYGTAAKKIGKGFEKISENGAHTNLSLIDSKECPTNKSMWFGYNWAKRVLRSEGVRITPPPCCSKVDLCAK